jgi:hypothetical protein
VKARAQIGGEGAQIGDGSWEEVKVPSRAN